MKKVKRTMGMLLSLILAVTALACGENPDGPTTVIIGKADSQTEIKVDGKNEDANQDNKVDVGGIIEAGYTFVLDGVNVYVDCDASEVVDKLGAYEYYEAPSCAFNGLDKVYTYSSFEIDTYPEGDKDYISAIIFKDDMVETQEGVCIGQTKQKVEERYGTPSSSDAKLYIYEKGDMKLRFIFDADGYIISIEYMSNKI